MKNLLYKMGVVQTRPVAFFLCHNLRNTTGIVNSNSSHQTWEKKRYQRTDSRSFSINSWSVIFPGLFFQLSTATWKEG
jgi:hypothetical protein